MNYTKELWVVPEHTVLLPWTRGSMQLYLLISVTRWHSCPYLDVVFRDRSATWWLRSKSSLAWFKATEAIILGLLGLFTVPVFISRLTLCTCWSYFPQGAVTSVSCGEWHTGGATVTQMAAVTGRLLVGTQRTLPSIHTLTPRAYQHRNVMHAIQCITERDCQCLVLSDILQIQRGMFTQGGTRKCWI